MSNLSYSICSQRATLGIHANRTIYRPCLQLHGVLDIEDIAEHMSEHNCKYDEGDIGAVLRQFIKCVVEMSLEGYKVKLGKLGSLTPSIKSTCELSADDVTADNITDLHLHWTPGEKTKNLKSKATFTVVPKRKNQHLLVQAEKAGQSTMSLSENLSPGGGGTGGGGSAGGE